MGAARSTELTGNHGGATASARRTRLLLAAASAIALLTACVTGPSPEEIHMMDWQQAARMDTPPAYQHYLLVYPDGQYSGMARSRMDELGKMEQASWDAALRINTETGWADFTARYPWSLHFAEADAMRAKAAAPRMAAEEKADWANAQRTDVIDLYETYLGKWPQGPNAGKAKDRLDALWRTDQGAYVRARRSGSPVELQEFVRAYPRSGYVADARREMDAIRLHDGEAWRVALQTNTVEAYDFYLSSQPWGEYRIDASNSIQDLRERDYQAWLYARQIDQIWAYEDYRNRYPWGAWYNTAYYRTDWIRSGRNYGGWNRGWDDDNYRGHGRDNGNGGGRGNGNGQIPPPTGVGVVDQARDKIIGRPGRPSPSQSGQSQAAPSQSAQASAPAAASPPPSPPPPSPPPPPAQSAPSAPAERSGGILDQARSKILGN
ncbi:MAG TPA: hypothetical protein VGO52_01790 [Hyphomonadaceae bacterium]|jgi:hypothetical protein|nr:hypothetical protein [Hyphomonadaceae bacterium]